MEKLLDDAFWFIDDHLGAIHGINLAITISNILFKNSVLVVISLVYMIPLWLLVVVTGIYGIKQGYFIW